MDNIKPKGKTRPYNLLYVWRFEYCIAMDHTSKAMVCRSSVIQVSLRWRLCPAWMVSPSSEKPLPPHRRAATILHLQMLSGWPIQRIPSKWSPLFLPLQASWVTPTLSRCFLPLFMNLSNAKLHVYRFDYFLGREYRFSILIHWVNFI